MNEFVEQFLLESRELVDQATDDLIALEERPDDTARLDSVFRAFHTLKGAAGIVDFTAMGRALHAAEDVLVAVRRGTRPITPELIGHCLTCLDQVVQWLDSMQSDSQIPASADASADVIVQRFSRVFYPSAVSFEANELPTGDWARDLLARHTATAAGAAAAIRYMPDADCFFRGEDPLAFFSSLPELVALELKPTRPWPVLENMDPFACQLTILALISGSGDEVAQRIDGLRGEVEIRTLQSTTESADLPLHLRSAARALLEAQILLVRETTGDEGAQGRLASAGKVAVNVLRSLRREAEALELDRVLSESQGAGDALPLVTAIEAVLNGTFGVAREDAAIAKDASPTAEAALDEAGPVAVSTRDTAARALRVDVERIDALVRLTGEITVAKNGIGHLTELAHGGANSKTLAMLLKQHFEALDRVVRELQQSVLSIRVLPLSHVFNRFPRLVREMSVTVGKAARLITEGEGTEADKAIVEALFEPLLHAVRNAIDHGIESADRRVALGKRQPAIICLRAFREGEHVVVEVEDDGHGVDVARIREVALERGIASPQAVQQLSDQEAIELIFAPGFSTATAVTGLSGRGVGMDSVRSTVERLGGRVEVKSRSGQGATFRFTLPFTVMMTRVMTVEAGGQVFGVPFDAVVETVRMPRNRIVKVGSARAFVLRDRTIPLIDLAHALGEAQVVTKQGEEVSVVISAVSGQLVGLEVDRPGERMDVMLRPVDGLLTGIPGIAGTTLLSNGRVLLVLELREVLH